MEHVAMITTKEVKDWIDRGDDMLLVDVLGENSYHERHLPGAVSAPAHAMDFLHRVAELASGRKDKTIVVYCSSSECASSPTAAKMLMGDGYTAVYDYDAGLKGWNEEGYDFE